MMVSNSFITALQNLSSSDFLAAISMWTDDWAKYTNISISISSLSALKLCCSSVVKRTTQLLVFLTVSCSPALALYFSNNKGSKSIMNVWCMYQNSLLMTVLILFQGGIQRHCVSIKIRAGATFNKMVWWIWNKRSKRNREQPVYMAVHYQIQLNKKQLLT